MNRLHHDRLNFRKRLRNMLMLVGGTSSPDKLIEVTKYQHEMSKELTGPQNTFLNLYTTGSWKINDEGKVDIDGSFSIFNCPLYEMPFEFGKVTGSFVWKDGHLRTLKGSPDFIGENFNIAGCRDLNNFEHGPRKVMGAINAHNNFNILLEDMSLNMIKSWWESGLNLSDFKEKHRGALKFDKYDL